MRVMMNITAAHDVTWSLWIKHSAEATKAPRLFPVMWVYDSGKLHWNTKEQ